MLFTLIVALDPPKLLIDQGHPSWRRQSRITKGPRLKVVRKA
jgi:hypothetical protein